MRRNCLSFRYHLVGLTVLGLATLLSLPGPLSGQSQSAATEQEKGLPVKLSLPEGWGKVLTWRSIGPATMGGRIVALAVAETDPSTWWVATASGGLLKTTNNGITFEHQFDREKTVSLGDVAVAPSDPKLVWVGTGENNPRNSVSYGDGVYKSTDGGKTWKNRGLKKSFQIGRIAIHPTDPDVVYVGALGRLYGPSEERGLYKTADGGKTWNKVLSIDDKTGIIDLRMHPRDPETLIVATYERQRDGYDFNDPAKKWGAGSSLRKTTDGGKTWTKLTKGLPACKLGRIGIDYYRKDPRIVYAVVESEKIGTGPPEVVRGTAYMGVGGQDGVRGVELLEVTQGGPADKAGLKPGDVLVGIDDQPLRTYRGLLEIIRGHKPGDKLKVSRRRGQEVKVVNLTLSNRAARPDAPGGGDRPFLTALGGQVENVQDRQGANGPEYGGVYRSDDGGDTWQRVNSVNPRPMYFSQVRIDPSDDKNVYVLGIALYRSRDGGKTFRPDGARGMHGDQHALWIDPHDGRHMIAGTDGGHYVTYDRMDNWDRLNTTAIGQFYHVAVDPRRHYRVFGGLQDNGSWGGPSFTRSFTGPINEDWVAIGGGDGFTCRVDSTDPDLVYFTSQWGGIGRINLRTHETARMKPADRSYRFNWNTPYLLSHHNSRIVYYAGNYVFRSLDRGNNLRVISPEITATAKGSATALAESPRNPNVLWAGTDDGYLWVTRDGGKEWTNVTKNVGLPGLRWVNSIEASRFEEGRAYVVFDAHRSNEEKPYVYATEDHGQTWRPLHGTLPSWGTTRVLREDVDNHDLLYLGTEFAIWCSLDRGQTWQKLNNNLPTVAIHEIAIHPTAGEIVAATHGRSLWILDVTALQQVTSHAVSAKARLYRPVSAVRWAMEPSRGRTNRRFVGDNPPQGAVLFYSLTEKAQAAGIKVVDIDGKTVREIKAEAEPGLHKLVWDLTGEPPRVGGGRPRPGAGPPRGRPVAVGTYRVVLAVDGVEHSQTLKVEPDPIAPTAPYILEDEEEREGVKQIVD
ncbi:MAG: PDZ domain-containing protein [Planctomycetes bacterium]|nr:PDZ domain-containing protein [Planctomycetota bacterium]